jgi:hypothetical protein
MNKGTSKQKSPKTGSGSAGGSTGGKVRFDGEDCD